MCRGRGKKKVAPTIELFGVNNLSFLIVILIQQKS